MPLILILALLTDAGLAPPHDEPRSPYEGLRGYAGLSVSQGLFVGTGVSLENSLGVVGGVMLGRFDLRLEAQPGTNLSLSTGFASNLLLGGSVGFAARLYVRGPFAVSWPLRLGAALFVPSLGTGGQPALARFSLQLLGVVFNYGRVVFELGASGALLAGRGTLGVLVSPFAASWAFLF